MCAITSDFFLGAMTGRGFVDLFPHFYDETAGRAVLLKGGSGTGKSTLLKRIATAAEEENKGDVERIHCSSDPDSLDGVSFRDNTCFVLDATAPHAHDPRWPGAVDELVNLGDHWQETTLRKAKFKIVELTRRKKRLYEEVCRYMEAASDAWEERRRLTEPFLRYDKMNGETERFLGPSGTTPYAGTGKEICRILYAVTPNGYVGFDHTLTAFAEHITEVKDDHGIADLFMNKLRAGFLERGHTVIRCGNVLSGDGTDALILPEEKRAFVTSHFLREYSGRADETVHLKQFLSAGDVRSCKARLTFHRKLAVEMVTQAVEKMKEARELHGMLEEIYGRSMDFKAIDRLSDQVLVSFGLQKKA